MLQSKPSPDFNENFAHTPPLTRRQRRIERLRHQLKLDRPLTEDEIRRRMRPRGNRFWVWGTIALTVVAIYSGSRLLLLCALLTFTMGIFPELWYTFSLMGVTFRRTFSARRVNFGETVTISYRVENRKFIPVPWLEVEDEFGGSLRFETKNIFETYKNERNLLIAAFTLWGYQRVTRRYRLHALERGVWDFGPAYLRAGDPFGFLVAERPVRSEQSSLTVLPIVLPLDRFGLDPHLPFGALATPRHFIEDPSQIVGARDYRAGDPLRRVHWKATARTMTLQSKVYPTTTAHTLVVLLDVNTTKHITFGINPPLLELGIAAAASVAAWGLKAHFNVGISSNGVPGRSFDNQVMRSFHDVITATRVPTSQHPDQLARILSLLALLQPYIPSSMTQLLAREESRLPNGSTIVFIGAGAALNAELVARLERLKRRGHTVALWLTGDPPAMPTRTLSIYPLGGEEAWHAIRSAALQSLGHADGDGTGDNAPSNGANAAGADAGNGAAGADPGRFDQREPHFSVG